MALIGWCVKERETGTPLLGVCVGMQLLFDESDEFGSTPGLGIVTWAACAGLRTIWLCRRLAGIGFIRERPHALFEGVADGSFCYFVHSFYCEPLDETVVAGETEYGARYASVVAQGNICGVQFHPEKSQDVGLRMLRNFATVNRSWMIRDFVRITSTVVTERCWLNESFRVLMLITDVWSKGFGLFR